MAAGTHDDREPLFQAAERLAPRLPLAQLTPEKLCAEAGLPPASFSASFKDLTDFLLQGQQRFMNGLRDRIVQRTGAAAAGTERIRAAAETFLDGCQAQHALRNWFIETRAVQDQLLAALANQNRVYGVLVTAELTHMSWPYPAEGAQLWIAAVMEASVAEHQAGRVLDDMREVLWDFLRTYS
jgi:AcrR family transcriptional regulator